MPYDVFLKRVSESRYQATAMAFPDCAVVGSSREEALAKVRCAIRAYLAEGEIVRVEIDEPQHPLLRFAGMFADDPTFDDFLSEIETYRREVDEEQRLHAEASP